MLKKILCVMVLFISRIVSYEAKVPIIYHPNYDSHSGQVVTKVMEWLHPFDGKRSGKIYNYLLDTVGLKPEQFYTPERVSDPELMLVHHQAYLESLASSKAISHALGSQNAIAAVPNGMLQQHVVEGMRWATGGTVLGAQLALKEGWAINLGGGYHHAKPHGSGVGSLLADVPLAIQKLRSRKPGLNVLIVDLDAHQGNGNALFAKNDPKIFIFDIYNMNEYPVFSSDANNANADDARQWITFAYPVDGSKIGQKNAPAAESTVDFSHVGEHTVEDEEYLSLLRGQLPAALKKLEHDGNKPDLIIYNAGTDSYQKDALGGLKLSAHALIKRDEFVFDIAQQNNIPILMVLSGGYSIESPAIVARSIENILQYKKVIGKNVANKK